jgi:hypothetical protein
VLVLAERIRPDGSHARSWAEPSADGTALLVADDDGVRGLLPVVAVDRVMARYGRPLEEGLALDGESIELAGGYRLRRFRFHAIVDAEARDYLVWERPGEEPLAAISATVAAALRFLVGGGSSKN